MLAHRYMIEKLLHCVVINTNIIMENSIDSKFGGDYVVKDLTSLPEKLE